MMLILAFYTSFRPPSRYLKNKFEIFSYTFTSLWGPKCVLVFHLTICIQTDTQTQMIPYIHSSLVSNIPHTQKCCADLTTIFGVEIWIPSCIGSSPFFLHDLHTSSLHFSIWGMTILYKIMFQTTL